MRKLVLARLRQLVLVVFGIATVVFFLTRLSGDPALSIAGPDATKQQIATIRDQLGLNDSLAVQYLHFLKGLVTLNFGKSLQFRQPAMSIVMDRLPWSLLLASVALIIATVVSIPLGMHAATHRGSWSNKIVLSISMVFQSAPSFVVGLLLTLFFSVSLRWFPSFGNEDPLSIVLPAITLASFMTARQIRLVQAYAAEELSRGYVRTARSLGYSNARTRYRHVLRNVLVPLVSLLGIEFGLFIGGAVVTEYVFSWPGIGGLMVTAVTARDYPLIQAGVFVIGIAVVLVNFLVDLLYQVIDPRIKAGASA
jgi:peptide/nickel transport system permease protein